MITREQIVLWLQRLGEVCEENRELLTQLDAAIGDADHGINMERRFKKVAAAEEAAGSESLDAPAFAGILRSGVNRRGMGRLLHVPPQGARGNQLSREAPQRRRLVRVERA